MLPLKICSPKTHASKGFMLSLIFFKHSTTDFKFYLRNRSNFNESKAKDSTHSVQLQLINSSTW